MRNKFANLDREVQCLALFAREAEGEEIMMQIAEVDEDIKIVVENPEGSIQYVLDDNNQFQVTDINEDNILNEIVDVLEKSELMKQDLLEQSPRYTDKKHIIDRFLHEIEDYNNNFTVEQDLHESFTFVSGDFDDLCIYLPNFSEPNNNVDKAQTATEFPQSDKIDQFKECSNPEEYQILSEENRQVLFCNDNTHSNADSDAIKELKKKKTSKGLNLELWKCTTCDYLARTKTLLSRHQSAKHKVPFACEKCDATFETNLKLNRHNCAARNILCPFSSSKSTPCNYVARTKRLLSQHQSANHKVAFACEKCTASFTTSFKLKYHNSKPCVARNLVCPLCGHLFDRSARVDAHIKRYHALQCAHCSKIFYNDVRFKSHLRFHKIRKYID